MDYETDIRIDETALDVEWLQQPRLMMRYCVHAEEARREVDYAKERLDVKKAELDKSIRSKPERYGVEKVTESAVQAAILADEGYQELSNAFIEAKYESNIANAAVRAFDQRKSALENLVRLYAQQYFAGPRVPRDLRDEVSAREAKQQRTNEAVGARMRRRKRKDADDD